MDAKDVYRPSLAPVNKLGVSLRAMSFEEWQDVPPCPIQRNTELRLGQALTYLKADPRIDEVAMAEWPGGRCKLEGHTRELLMSQGKIPLVENFTVTVYKVKTVEDAKTLYETFNSRKGVKNGQDAIQGAQSEGGVEYENDLLKRGRYSTAIKYAFGILHGLHHSTAFDITKLDHYWRDELGLLDTTTITSAKFPTGVLIAALLTLKRYGAPAMEFWDNYAEGRGTRMEGRMDGVQALTERVLQFKGGGLRRGITNIRTLVLYALSAFEKWNQGEDYATTVTDEDGNRTSSKAGVRAMSEPSVKKWCAQCLIAIEKREKRGKKTPTPDEVAEAA